jgi:hypothetical protein
VKGDGMMPLQLMAAVAKVLNGFCLLPWHTWHSLTHLHDSNLHAVMNAATPSMKHTPHTWKVMGGSVGSCSGAAPLPICCIISAVWFRDMRPLPMAMYWLR